MALSTCIISILRLKSLNTLDYADLTYSITAPYIFTALEPSLAVTIACVPTLRPLLGGRYTATGTAKFGNTTQKRPNMRRSKTPRIRGRFDTLVDGASTSQFELHPVYSGYGSEVRANDNTQHSPRGDDNASDRCITINQEWKVTSDDARL